MLQPEPRARTFSSTFLSIARHVSTPSQPPVAIDRLARKRLRRHFWLNRLLYWPELFQIAGLVSVICGLAFLDAFVNCLLLAIVLAGTGFVVRSWRNLYVASQQEFDHIAETDYKGIQAVALARFDLTLADLRDPEPCKFRSATKRPIGIAFSGVRTGSDEKARRSPMEFLVINFGHAHLFVFRCVWDLTTGNTLWEETLEFAYRDIACVELTHTKETIRINLRTRELLPALKKEGIVPLHRQVQLPADERVALRLVSGEQVDLFAWKRSSGGIFSGEGKRAFATAQRLQKLVRELKLRPSAPAPAAPAPAAPAPPAALPAPQPSAAESPQLAQSASAQPLAAKPTASKPTQTIRHLRGAS